MFGPFPHCCEVQRAKVVEMTGHELLGGFLSNFVLEWMGAQNLGKMKGKEKLKVALFEKG